jgi:hypothetical protein
MHLQLQEFVIFNLTNLFFSYTFASGTLSYSLFFFTLPTGFPQRETTMPNKYARVKLCAGDRFFPI